MYPYQEYESSSALTQRLKDQLHRILLHNCHSQNSSAQVKQHKLSTCNKEEHQLAQHWLEPDSDTATLKLKIGPVHKRLYAAQAYPHIHPYLNHQAWVPHPNSAYPGDLHQYELIMEQAVAQCNTQQTGLMLTL